MIPSPILKVLSTFQKCNSRFLLMGGQACVLYAGAEFSRDIDLAISPDEANLERVRAALAELKAERIFVPELRADALLRGHACHFRAHAEGAEGLRIDVMSKMRGCPDFDQLWERRTLYRLDDSPDFPVLSIPDLVAAKKTQRNKDWPMIERLIDSNIERFRHEPTAERVRLWLKECRTPENLIELAASFPGECRAESQNRPALEAALAGDSTAVLRALREEEDRERKADREYWAPLKKELEAMRHGHAS